MRPSFLWIAPVLLVLAAVPVLASDSPHPSDRLFGLDRVWDIHLELTQQEWAKLQSQENMDWDLLAAVNRMFDDIDAGNDFQGDGAGRPGFAGYFGVEHQYGRGRITVGDSVFDNVGIRYKGNGTFVDGARTGKFSFKIDFGEYQQGIEFLGMTKINLNSNVTDYSMLREALAYSLFREADIHASRVGWAKVSATVRGEFEGKYLGHCRAGGQAIPETPDGTRGRDAAEAQHLQGTQTPGR